MVTSLSISGLRGFGKEQTIQFAVPNGEEGSGLTFIVGSNNSGKTTILEGLRSFDCRQGNSPSFSERKRNTKCNGIVSLSLQVDDTSYIIKTVPNGGSQTEFIKSDAQEGEYWNGPSLYILPSRRFVEYEFSRNETSREDYIYNQQNYANNRVASLSEFSSRLFAMQRNKEEFNTLLKRVLGYDLHWTIEQNDNGSYYLKVIINGCEHSSEGLGDGIWSVFTICDALYDSEPGAFIAIDEPELSLHPAYQKRIMSLLRERAKDRQIVICTHSNYFIDWESLCHSAVLYRAVKDNEGDICLFSLSEESKRTIQSLSRDINQPHTVGLEAKEIFFLEDNVIITEGQEDVIMYAKAANQLHLSLNGNFFGWGSGGAANIKHVCMILQDLGYKKVSAIFDGDKKDFKEEAEAEYPDYNFQIIPRDDIRDKKEHINAAKDGMMTEKGKLKDEHAEEMKVLLENINAYFSRG